MRIFFSKDGLNEAAEKTLSIVETRAELIEPQNFEFW